MRAGTGLVIAVVVIGAVPLVGMMGLGAVVSSSTSGPGSVDQAPSALASAEVPPGWIALTEQAAADNGVCAMSWTILASIAEQESSFGSSTLAGVSSGSNSAGAEGPMQFEPATFVAYDTPVPAGGLAPPSPYDSVDAVDAAARMLCANGVDTNPSQAVWDYNHSDAYVSEVLARAATYATVSPTVGSTAGLEALAAAVSFIGTPYVWGGSTPGRGFDCSGLVQWVFAEVGVALPRVAQDQFDSGPAIPLSGLAPGDLVFFGSGPTDVTHVGIYAGENRMVDAPYTGADVRYDSFTVSIGAGWGDEGLVGATAP